MSIKIFIMKTFISTALCTLPLSLTSCGKHATTVTTAAGKYTVEINPKINLTNLPTNTEFEIADNDITKYAVQLCGLDMAFNHNTKVCSIFVQPNKDKLLSGYVTITQGKDTNISTELKTDRSKGGTACWIDGKMAYLDYKNNLKNNDITKDFDANMTYQELEKSPGDMMVTPISDNDAPQDGTNIGMWYFHHKNNKFRITQERWNYCYKNQSIDDAFSHIITLKSVK